MFTDTNTPAEKFVITTTYEPEMGYPVSRHFVPEGMNPIAYVADEAAAHVGWLTQLQEGGELGDVDFIAPYRVNLDNGEIAWIVVLLSYDESGRPDYVQSDTFTLSINYQVPIENIDVWPCACCGTITCCAGLDADNTCPQFDGGGRRHVHEAAADGTPHDCQADVPAPPHTEKMYLVCRGCGEAFDDITVITEHGNSDPSGSAGWCGDEGFDIMPESDAM